MAGTVLYLVPSERERGVDASRATSNCLSCRRSPASSGLASTLDKTLEGLPPLTTTVDGSSFIDAAGYSPPGVVVQ